MSKFSLEAYCVPRKRPIAYAEHILRSAGYQKPTDGFVSSEQLLALIIYEFLNSMNVETFVITTFLERCKKYLSELSEEYEKEEKLRAVHVALLDSDYISIPEWAITLSLKDLEFVAYPDPPLLMTALSLPVAYAHAAQGIQALSDLPKLKEEKQSAKEG